MAILFAQGYRFNFNTLKIVKTGGIFIKTSTDNAKIFINDKYIESTSGILTHTILISGLTPKNYNVFIHKENYYPWNKTVEVKNGMVTELKSIILFPLELKKIKIAELPGQMISEFSVNSNAIEIKNSKTKILNTYGLNDGKLISTEKYKPATSTEEMISPDKDKKLYASNNKILIEYSNSKNKELIADYESPINFFDWFNDSEHVIWFANNELTVAELDNRGGKRNSIKFYLNIIPPVFWDRDNSDFYYFEKSAVGKNVLYKINFGD